ncbi:ABC transporter substrate-binding protein [Brevundimonas sp.]|uniref:ABC transporter substrate-binding protein n=1 Tax=Brevundimonas sp. TaxID=1871086 RepID=UPI0025E46736|nr:ABC transporter substrate-binding protein [Brevundimonas sp.]
MRLTLAALAAALAAGSASASPRVVSLDQCADQYVLALADPASVAAVSPRADDRDSWLRSRGAAAHRARPTLEAILAARPEIVVRYWGGDERLLQALQHRGVRVVRVEDAVDFEGVRANIDRVSAALNRRGRGRDLVADMDRRLDRSREAWAGESALYLTPSGWTAGGGTLIDAMLAAAGMSNAWAGPAFAPVSVERLILQPPRRFVLGFFDSLRTDRRGAGRHPSVARRTMRGAVVSLPGAMLGCPAWFAADGAWRIARASPAR